MPEPKLAQRGWAFREFVLDLDRGALLRDGVDVPLRPKSLAVLGHLVERHGRLVTKDELLDAVWGHTVVTEGALTQVVIDLRRVLGDSQQRMIRTLRRRGYRFDCPVEALPGIEIDGDAPDAPRAAPGAPPADGAPAVSALRRSRLARGSGLAVGLVLAACGLWWGAADRGVADREPVAAASADRSIAVLPFADMSPRQDQEYFSEGLSEELLNLLAQVPGLRVIARTSSFSYKDGNADIATIGRELNVTYVLEGSVRKWGDRLRITAQLVEAADNSHLWSKTWDRKLDDLFVIQDEIAASVVEALEVTLAGGEVRRVGGTRSPRAFELYLQAQYLYNRRAPGDMARVRAYYEAALAEDPDYAEAWAGLAGAWMVELSERHAEWEIAEPQWREAVERALAKGPDLAESHLRAAQYYSRTRGSAAAQPHRRRALELGRNDALILSVAAADALRQGQFEEAVALQRRAVSLTPIAATYRHNLAALLERAGRFEEAKAQYRQLIVLNPASEARYQTEIGFVLLREGRYEAGLAQIERWGTEPDRDQGRAIAYQVLGRTAEAEAALERLIAMPGATTPVLIADVHAQRGDADEAFRWLAVAQELRREENPALALAVDFGDGRYFGLLKDDPRWAALSNE